MTPGETDGDAGFSGPGALPLDRMEDLVEPKRLLIRGGGGRAADWAGGLVLWHRHIVEDRGCSTAEKLAVYFPILRDRGATAAQMAELADAPA